MIDFVAHMRGKAMVFVGLMHGWRALFTTGKSAPGVSDGRSLPDSLDKQVTVRSGVSGQGKMRVFFARLTCHCWIRRKPLGLMPTPATTVLSLPSEIPRTPESLSKAASISVSLSVPMMLPAAVTEVVEPKFGPEASSRLAEVVKRIDRIVDAFHRVLGSELDPKQYRACLRARVALHSLLLRLDSGMALEKSQDWQANVIAFTANQITSDGRKINAGKIVDQVQSAHPMLASITSDQSQGHAIFPCAAEVLINVLKEFAGKKETGIYDSYVAFGLMLQSTVAVADAPVGPSVRMNPFKLALDWSNPSARLRHNAVPESLDAEARATFIRQVKAWGVELKFIGDALAAVYGVHTISISSEDASPVTGRQRGLQSAIEKEVDEEMRRAGAEYLENKRYRDLLAASEIPNGINWLENAAAYLKTRKTRFLPADFRRPAATVNSMLTSTQAMRSRQEVAKTYAREIARIDRTDETLSAERSKARRPAYDLPRFNSHPPHLHPVVEIFKQEMYKLQSGLLSGVVERPASPVSNFSHLGHKFNDPDASTEPLAGK